MISERQFDQEKLGRGHLSNLQDENYEFGAWEPIASKDEDVLITEKKDDGPIEFVGDFVESGVAARKSDDHEESYYPSDDVTRTEREVDSTEGKAAEERSSSSVGSRTTRDCKLASIANVLLQCKVWKVELSWG